jgi:hypothetical protein
MMAKELNSNVGVAGFVIDGNASRPLPRGRCVHVMTAYALQI